jgi:hypothetical protein
MLIRTMTGKENWKNHSAKLQVFYSPTTPGGREIHIGVASRDPTIAITQVRSTTNPEMGRRLFEVEVLEPQTRARPTMTTETVVVGTQTVNVPIRRRGRIMPG